MDQRLITNLRTSARSAEARTLLSRVATIIGTRVSGSVLTLAYTLLIARVTSPQDLGIAMSALSSALLTSVLLSVNVESGSIRFLVGYVSRGKMAKAAGFLRFNWTLIVLIFPLFFVIFFGFAYWQAAGQGGATPWTYALTLAAAPVLALTRVYGRHATALDAVLRGSLPRMLVRPALFTIVLGVIFVLGLTVSAQFVVFMFLMAALFTAAVQLLLLRDTLRPFKGQPRDRSEWRSWLSTGVLLAPMLVMRENLRDVIIASSALAMPAAEVARLAISISFLAMLHFALRSVDISFSPRISKALAENRMARCRRLLAATSLLKCALFLGGITALYLFQDIVVRLLGPHYAGIGDTMFVLALMPLADALFGPGYLILNVSGRQRAIFWLSLAGVLSVAIATCLAGKAYGLQGAALAASSAYFLQQLAYYVMCRYQTGIDPSVVGALLSLRSGGSSARTPNPASGED